MRKRTSEQDIKHDDMIDLHPKKENAKGLRVGIEDTDLGLQVEIGDTGPGKDLRKEVVGEEADLGREIRETGLEDIDIADQDLEAEIEVGMREVMTEEGMTTREDLLLLIRFLRRPRLDASTEAKYRTFQSSVVLFPSKALENKRMVLSMSLNFAGKAGSLMSLKLFP